VGGGIQKYWIPIPALFITVWKRFIIYLGAKKNERPHENNWLFCKEKNPAE